MALFSRENFKRANYWVFALYGVVFGVVFAAFRVLTGEEQKNAAMLAGFVLANIVLAVPASLLAAAIINFTWRRIQEGK